MRAHTLSHIHTHIHSLPSLSPPSPLRNTAHSRRLEEEVKGVALLISHRSGGREGHRHIWQITYRIWKRSLHTNMYIYTHAQTQVHVNKLRLKLSSWAALFPTDDVDNGNYSCFTYIFSFSLLQSRQLHLCFVLFYSTPFYQIRIRIMIRFIAKQVFTYVEWILMLWCKTVNIELRTNNKRFKKKN